MEREEPSPTFQMLDEFYEAFDVKEGDGMYVKPEDRLKTWGK